MKTIICSVLFVLFVCIGFSFGTVFGILAIAISYMIARLFEKEHF